MESLEPQSEGISKNENVEIADPDPDPEALQATTRTTIGQHPAELAPDEVQSVQLLLPLVETKEET